MCGVWLSQPVKLLSVCSESHRHRISEMTMSCCLMGVIAGQYYYYELDKKKRFIREIIP